jgi:hypothetical protein
LLKKNFTTEIALEYVKSIKACNILLVDGFTLWKEKNIHKYNLEMHWIFYAKVKASCYTEVKNVLTISDNYHVPDEAKIDSRKVIQKV